MYTTKNTLPQATRESMVTLLNVRLADAIDLVTHTKQAHMHPKRRVKTMKRMLTTFMLGAISVVAITAWADDGVPTPERIQVAASLSDQDATRLLATAKQYFAFWNTGIDDYAKAALAQNFVDLNLPEGRPQGPTGPLVASAGFRKAVPDLSLTVKSVYVLKNKVIGQLLFEGHFTGTFGELEGEGQAIAFSAVDMYTIEDGRITENWHLEDNLTLMQQLGVINE